MKKIFLLCLFISACSSVEKKDNLITTDEYVDLIEQHTQHVQKYDGLYAKLDVQATLHTPKVLEAQHKKKAQELLWSTEEQEKNHSTTQQQIATQTEVFLSLYTPERKASDLIKNKALWRVFLEINGKRYEGSVSKINIITGELQSFYPYFNSFYRPYKVTFPVSAQELVNQSATLTLSGPVGSAKFDFKN